MMNEGFAKVALRGIMNNTREDKLLLTADQLRLLEWLFNEDIIESDYFDYYIIEGTEWEKI